jgi:D-3-phosphoglycerate dehydrogenase
MLGLIDEFRATFAAAGVELLAPAVVQTLSEDELVRILPGQDGWIAGDDPANRRVLSAGAAGRLRVVVKWGIGTDNVDFDAARDLKLVVSNTPGMFGREVADVAMAYVTGLARDLFYIDRCVRIGGWPKPQGVSLHGKVMSLAGLGDIGSNVAIRAQAAGIRVIGYDPRYEPGSTVAGVEVRRWPAGLEEADFLVLTCPLTLENHHMVNRNSLGLMKPGIRIVNVARGPLISEDALVEALRNGVVHSVALDVMEIEPLPATSPLRELDRCVFGSHNGSNTVEAVRRASDQAISQLFANLGIR